MKTLKKITAVVLVLASIFSIMPIYASTNVTLDVFENDVFSVVRELTVEEVVNYQRYAEKEEDVFGYDFTNKVTPNMDVTFGTGVQQVLMNGIYDSVNDIYYSLSDGAWISRWYQDGKALLFVPERTKYKYYEVLLHKTSEITVYLNGKKLVFDQKPIMENNRTLVPLRKIFEELGCTVEWDNATQTATATKGRTTIKLTVGDTTAYKNKAPIVIDAPAQKRNGRILVPVRFIAACFGVQTDWDENLDKVTLTTKADFK